MNILVNGGAGYIGSHTCLELIAAGHRPVILDNLSNSNKGVLDHLADMTGQKIPFYQQDYQDEAGLRRIIKEEKVEGLIHFAAYKAVGESTEKPLKYYWNNTAGLTRLLAVLQDEGFPVDKIIFSSTAAVYGTPADGSATEESAINPESTYGWSKYMSEVILRDTCQADSRLSATVLRYFNVVGAHESGKIGEQSKTRPQNLLPVIVEAVVNEQPLTVMGTDYPTDDGTCQRDYIHVVDLAKAHVAALEKASGFNVYNIGTGKPTSVLELINAFEKVTGMKVPHTLGARRPGDPVVSYAVVSKAEQELGWKAERTIEQACADAWRWQTQNPRGYN